MRKTGSVTVHYYSRISTKKSSSQGYISIKWQDIPLAKKFFHYVTCVLYKCENPLLPNRFCSEINTWSQNLERTSSEMRNAENVICTLEVIGNVICYHLLNVLLFDRFLNFMWKTATPLTTTVAYLRYANKNILFLSLNKFQESI